MVLSLLPLTALGQSDEALGRFQVGPLYLSPKLELRTGVDTNVFNDAVDPIPDAVTTIRTALDAAMPVGERLRFTGNGYLDFNHFRREQTERSTDFYGEGRAELDISRFTFFGEGGGGQARQRFSIEIDERLLRQERWASVGVDLRLTERIQATLSGTARQFEFERSLTRAKQALDRNTLTASAELRYSVATFTQAVFSFEAREDRFPSREQGLLLEGLAPGGSPREIRSFRAVGGFEFGEDAVITGRILAGFREFPRGVNGVNASAFRTPAFTASITTPLPWLGLLTLTGERDVFYSVTRAAADPALNNSYVATSLRVGLATPLPFELLGRGDVGFEEADYVLPFSSRRGVAVDRVDHRWTATVSLLRIVSSSLRVGGAVTYERRISKVPRFQYEGFRYGIVAEIVP